MPNTAPPPEPETKTAAPTSPPAADLTESLIVEKAADPSIRPFSFHASDDDLAELKRRIWEQIVRYGLPPTEPRAALLRRIYLEALEPGGVFAPFLPGAFEAIGSGDARGWLWSFASYDRALNRPFLHVVYSDWDGEPPAEGTEEHAELWATVRTAVRVLKDELRCDAVNVGLNLGPAAGGSQSDHLHVHCVPRWQGDANFIGVAAETRVLPIGLAEAGERLRAAWPS